VFIGRNCFAPQAIPPGFGEKSAFPSQPPQLPGAMPPFETAHPDSSSRSPARGDFVFRIFMDAMTYRFEATDRFPFAPSRSLAAVDFPRRPDAARETSSTSAVPAW